MLTLRRGLALVVVSSPVILALACGAGTPPSQLPPSLPAVDAGSDGPVESAALDGATDAASSAVVRTHPATCAQGTSPLQTARPLNRGELDRLTHLAEADASVRDRARIQIAQGSLYLQAGMLDDALALLGPVVKDGSVDVALDGVEVYLAALNEAGPACRAVLTDEVVKLRQRLCPGSRDERCSRLERLEFEVRQSDATFRAESEPREAAAAFDGLFRDFCHPPADRQLRCDEVAYNDAVLWLRVGDAAKAKAMLGTMKDPRNGMATSPLVKKLECVLFTKDGGACW